MGQWYATFPNERKENFMDHLLSNKAYDHVKFAAQIFFPALGSLYFAIASIWGLPEATEVVGTIVLIDTFLGALLSVSKTSYNASDAKFDGTMDIGTNELGNKTIFTLNLNTGPESLQDAKEIKFKVNPLP